MHRNHGEKLFRDYNNPCPCGQAASKQQEEPSYLGKPNGTSSPSSRNKGNGTTTQSKTPQLFSKSRIYQAQHVT